MQETLATYASPAPIAGAIDSQGKSLYYLGTSAPIADAGSQGGLLNNPRNPEDVSSNPIVNIQKIVHRPKGTGTRQKYHLFLSYQQA